MWKGQSIELTQQPSGSTRFGRQISIIDQGHLRRLPPQRIHDPSKRFATRKQILIEPAPGTPPSSLKQSWASWAAANPANGATFWQNKTGLFSYGIGQYHLLHCVTALKRVFGSTFPRIDAAETTARQLMAARIAAIRALPAGQKAAHLGSMEIYQNLVSSTETGTVTTY